jgi:hypothetical protein
MSEQLLGCHNIHASIHRALSECTPQRMPRHIRGPRFLARLMETRLQIDKRFSGIEIGENKITLYVS